MLERIRYAILYVTEMRRSTDFYVEVLGFTVLDGSDEQFAELKLGDSELALNLATDSSKRPGYQTILLSSNDIEADYSALESDVQMLTPLTSTSYGKTFIFADPDGNKVEVVQS